MGDIINTQGDWALADLVDSGLHLTVLRQLVKARDKRTTGPVFGPTKTGRSRIIDLSDEVVHYAPVTMTTVSSLRRNGPTFGTATMRSGVSCRLETSASGSSRG